MKINAIREYYRENQCNTFRSNLPCIFTLVILMPFIVNIISFQITIGIWDASVVIFLLWLFVSNIPKAKKCTSNFFGVSLQCC